jgi:hypothetical protein
MSEPNASELAPANFPLEEERRGAPRHSCDVPASWREWGTRGSSSWVARIHNISATGIGLTTTYRVKPGSVLVIHLQDKNHNLSRPLPVRVMHATQQADGTWLLGCAFVRRVSEEDLQSLLADRTPRAGAPSPP